MLSPLYRRLHELHIAATLQTLATRRLPLAQVIATVVHQAPMESLHGPDYSPRYDPRWLWGCSDTCAVSWDCSVYICRQDGILHVYTDCCSWSEDGERQECRRLFFELAPPSTEPIAFCYAWSRHTHLLRYTEDLADMRPWHRALLAAALERVRV